PISSSFNVSSRYEAPMGQVTIGAAVAGPQPRFQRGGRAASAAGPLPLPHHVAEVAGRAPQLDLRVKSRRARPSDDGEQFGADWADRGPRGRVRPGPPSRGGGQPPPRPRG